MLDDDDRTLSESDDSATIVDYESDSRFSDYEPTNAEPYKDYLCEYVSKIKMSKHAEKAKIVDRMLSIFKIVHSLHALIPIPELLLMQGFPTALLFLVIVPRSYFLEL